MFTGSVVALAVGALTWYLLRKRWRYRVATQDRELAEAEAYWTRLRELTDDGGE